ncbi:MAG: cytochrome c biogenesis CcdA family protein [Agrobacterium albertimagni]
MLAPLAAAFAAGVLTSASPCVLAAVPITVGFVGSRAQNRGEALALSLMFAIGMTFTFAAFGLAAARIGIFFGSLGSMWSAVVGLILVALGLLLLTAPSNRCSMSLPLAIQQRLRGSGLLGAAGLGALTGTVMTPCATPALAAALSIAGAGGVLGGSMWAGAGMLLAYGAGHSILLLVAGIAPMTIQAATRRFEFQFSARFVRIMLAGLVCVSGLWLVWGSLAESVLQEWK